MDRWFERLTPRDTPLLSRIGRPRCLEWETIPGKDPEKAKELRSRASWLRTEEYEMLREMGIDQDDDWEDGPPTGWRSRQADQLEDEAARLDDRSVCVRSEPYTPMVWGRSNGS